MRATRTGWRAGWLAISIALAAPAAVVAAPAPVGSGTLDWGVKASFRNYVEGPIALGSIMGSDGATRNPDGTLRWTVAAGSYDQASLSGEVKTRGTVRFSGHNGSLELTIRDPRVVINGQAVGTLFADVSSRSQGSGQVEQYPNVDVASLDLSGAAPLQTATGFRYDAIPASLTANGAPAFGGFYQPGDALDPVSFEAIYGEPEAVRPPTIRFPAKVQKAGEDRTVRVARLACPSGPCSVAAPRRVRIAVDGERRAAKVLAPRSIETGSRATVSLKLKRSTHAALAGATTRVRVELAIAAGDDRPVTERARVRIGARG